MKPKERFEKWFAAAITPTGLQLWLRGAVKILARKAFEAGRKYERENQ